MVNISKKVRVNNPFVAYIVFMKKKLDPHHIKREEDYQPPFQWTRYIVVFSHRATKVDEKKSFSKSIR